MKKVLTYGTFDLLHRGHINLLKRAKELGDHLTVGLSTNEFNAIKGKQCFYSYEERKLVLEAIRYVDEVIVEDDWQQKRNDIESLDIAILVMGDDWRGKFDDLSELCNVVYLPRTDGISTTMLKGRLSISGDNVDLSTD
ncbi:MAG: glycerol-3-phosphate cytidylyltransferase [Luteolibacter sp.]